MNVFKTTLIAAALATTGFAGNAAAADLTDTFDVRITILETCNVLTASDINFGSTVNGAQTLAVNTSGLTTFGGLVGTGTALTSLSTGGGGTTALNGGTVTTTGTQTYTDAVTLGAATTLNASTVTFQSTLNGARTMMINAAIPEPHVILVTRLRRQSTTPSS